MFKRLFIILKLAKQNLLASKLRTFLTILGVIIGIAAVMIVMSVGSSAQTLILDQVRGVGANLIAILPGASEEDGPPAIAFGIVTTTLTNDDLDALRKKENAPHLEEASGYVLGNATVHYRNRSFPVNYQGVSATMPLVEDTRVEKGRFFTKEDESKLQRVVVLGSERAKDLFDERDPIGERIKIGDTSFRVIGVMEERGSVAFSNPDLDMYVPLSTAQKILLGIDYLSFIRASVDSESNIDVTREDVRMLLRDRHDLEDGDIDDFSVRSLTATLAILENVTNALKYFLVTVASIALIVGGIGIMNIMLISLKQRIREIGLRKALGALNRDIVVQFIIESVFIACVGGFFGVVLGMAITLISAIVIQSLGYEWPFLLMFSSVGVAFLVSVAIGVLFGLYPALKAAKVSPTEALRYE